MAGGSGCSATRGSGSISPALVTNRGHSPFPELEKENVPYFWFPASPQILSGILSEAEQRTGQRQSEPAARPMLVIFGNDSSAKNRRTIIACCSRPLRT
jgi:hypothetical protein